MLIDQAAVGHGFKKSEDSTSAITVKMVKNGRIEYSADFIIVCVRPYGDQMLRNEKKSGKADDYHFVDMPTVKELKRMERKLKKKLGSKWKTALFDKYLNINNNNHDSDKGLVHLYTEALKDLV